MTTTGPSNYTYSGGTTYPVGPLAVTDQLTTILPFPAGTVGVVACDVVNLSGLALLVSAGAGAGVWIMPGGQITLPVEGQAVQCKAQAVGGGGATAGQVVGTYMDAESFAGYSSAPGQLAVVNSSGTVTVSGPVTIAGTVPVEIFTSQSQLIQTIPAQAAGSATVNVPAFANSIGFIFQNNNPLPVTSGTLTATGVATGITYFSGFGIAQTVYVSPVRFDITPQLDTQLTVTWTAALNLPIEVVAYAESSGINTPSTSLSVAATDPTPKQVHTLYSVAMTNNVAVTVLPALSGSYVYEIIHLEMSWIAGNATAAGVYYWVGPGGLRFFASAVANASNPGNPQLALAAPWFTPGPLQAFANFGPTGVAAAMARQVPLAASLA